MTKQFWWILLLFSYHSNSDTTAQTKPTSTMDSSKTLTVGKNISSQKPIRLFDNHLPFKILSFTNTLNKNTTDTDTLKCNSWKLAPKSILEIIKNSKPIDGTTWDLNFLVLTCAKSVKILQSGQQYDIEINAAAFFSVSNGDTTVLFGDYAKSDRKYFIEGPDKE